MTTATTTIDRNAHTRTPASQPTSKERYAMFIRRHVFTAVAATGLLFAVACGAPAQAGGDQAGGPPAAAGAAGANPQDAQQVTIVTQDAMRFAPAELTVEAGRPVRLTLRNEGSATHDFQLTQGVARPVKVVAKGGQSASATFTITRPGTYAFVCSQFGHSLAGMRGTITAVAS
ncbi:MAG: cupredoxin domain-containing protein [Chloroflexota bacterium]